MPSERFLIYTKRDTENPSPSLVFQASARIDKGYMHLFTEGSASLQAKWTLVQERDGQQIVREYVCPMPDSYQNFDVIDVPDVFVEAGDRFDFSANEDGCVCTFVIDCYAEANPAPEPEPEPEPVPEGEEAPAEA